MANGTLAAVPTCRLRCSVYDKSGVVELAEGLHAAGWRILSSGGTAREIAAAGVPVTDVAELTGFPAILGHRVVTLHPTVHGGILADLGTRRTGPTSPSTASSRSTSSSSTSTRSPPIPASS